MARCSPITQYVVFYPDLLAVGGGTHDMCACIVRQDYTGAHIHALGWTSPQRLFILRLLRRERCPKFKITRQILLCSSLWNFFHPLHFAKKSAPSMCRFFNSLLYFEKESSRLKRLLIDGAGWVFQFFSFSLSHHTSKSGTNYHIWT